MTQVLLVDDEPLVLVGIQSMLRWEDYGARVVGTARNGVQALELKIAGYSGTDIAELYGVKPNHVGAWIARAAQKLKKDIFPVENSTANS